MKLTIYSPCYNKGATIKRTFESLINQTCHDFEWIVVNDGSTDNSNILIDEFSTNLFPIIKIHKKNEGLSSAMNIAVSKATGEFVLRLDSDDFLRPNAVEKIIQTINTEVELNDPKVGALVFLTCFEDNSIVGTHPFEKPTRCNFWDYRIKYKARGDRAEVFRTEYFRRFPMPQFPNEKFCPEGYVWNHFSDQYDAIYYPDKIYVRDYQPNSLSKMGVKKWIINPKAANLYLGDILNRNLPFNTYIRLSITYYRFSPYTGYSLRRIIKSVPLKATIIGLIPGYIAYIIEKMDTNFLQRIRSFSQK